MNKPEAKKRIEKLKKEIEHHRYLYHVLDRSEISDAALDSLKDDLAKLEAKYPEFITADSPTQRVGGMPLDKFEKVVHNSRMLSLYDAFNEKDMLDWEKRLLKLISDKKKLDYYSELKLDGLAISLKYQNQQFVLAATRGDGQVGENVSGNVKTINSVSLSLKIPKQDDLIKLGLSAQEANNLLDIINKGEVWVRGEVVMSKDVFAKLNKKYKKEGKSLLANTRNGAAGSIRQLNPKITAERELDFYAYELVSDFKFTKHEQKGKLASLLGFKTLKNNKYCKNLAEVFTFYKEAIKQRDKLPFEIDGLVIKVNDLSLWSVLGVVGKAPRYMMAYKFPAIQKTTRVNKVVWQVGRTGVLTPTAIMDPVEVGGVIVSRATIHNMDEIKRLDLKLGDTVIIERAGDVIPKIIKVLKNLRNGDEAKIPAPKKCPVCLSNVVREDGEVAFKCLSKNCFAVNLRKLSHWTSKKAIDIEGLGPKIVEQLMQTGLVRDIADFYALKSGDLVPLERFAEKSADNLAEAVSAKKTIDISRFIYGLGIHHVGEETALLLAKKFLKETKKNKEIEVLDLLNYFSKLSLEELQEENDIGPVVAQEIFNWWREEKNIEIIHKLIKNGIVLKIDQRLSITSQKSPILGKKIVLTGALTRLTREEAKDRIRELGASVSSVVTKNTDLVVVGENAGTKASRAKELGIKMINEKDFISLVKK